MAKAKIKHQEPVSFISALERAKTVLVLLESQRKFNPKQKEFYWRPEKMLSPLQDNFEMDEAFTILKKETGGNIQAKYETVDLLDESTATPAGMSYRRIFIRIKDNERFLKDIKKIRGMRENDPGDKIKKIEILRTEDSKLNIYINEDYSNEQIRPVATSIGWNMLIRLTRERSVTIPGARSIADFFNTNRNNMLYTRSSFPLCEIIKRDNETLSLNIPVSIITQKKLSQRKNKSA